MKWMGGKSKQAGWLSKEFVKHGLREGSVYVEPFVGAASVAARVAKDITPKSMILNDANKCLKPFWESIIFDEVMWYPSDSLITKEAYLSVTSNPKLHTPREVLFVRAVMSYGGRWGGSFVGTKVLTNPRALKTYGAVPANEAERVKFYRSTQKKREALRMCPSVEVYDRSYDELGIPNGAFVYCDPPYANTTGYPHIGDFDHAAFWDWVRDLSERCTVLVSELTAPKDITCVSSRSAASTLNVNKKNARTERLFKVTQS